MWSPANPPPTTTTSYDCAWLMAALLRCAAKTPSWRGWRGECKRRLAEKTIAHGSPRPDRTQSTWTKQTGRENKHLPRNARLDNLAHSRLTASVLTNATAEYLRLHSH